MEGQAANVLIVDDITSNLVILAEMIKSAGELLKKDVKTRDIPIIFISAMNTMEDKKEALNWGQ